MPTAPAMEMYPMIRDRHGNVIHSNIEKMRSEGRQVFIPHGYGPVGEYTTRYVENPYEGNRFLETWEEENPQNVELSDLNCKRRRELRK